MDAYAAALSDALERGAARARDYTADTVYFGGGTPSLWGERRLCETLERIYTCYTVAPGAEITLEANPESARAPGVLRALRRAGFNRLSLGMQSADDAELRAVGRVHSARDTEAAVEAARRAGFDNLSLDLIYGLPGQSRDGWLHNLAAAAALGAEHLSCYGLKAEPGTPLYARRDSLPDDDAQAGMYLDAAAFLAERGMEQYEISNFARPGFESRHNLKYWTLGEYIGFGPGAHSDFGGRRFAVARDLDAFLAGNAPLSEDSAISAAERAAERVMLGLRTARGLPAAELAAAEPFLRRCEAHGLAVRAGARWRLTPEGFLVSNRVILAVQEALNL